jgi:DNA-binding transcriptional ArsR family regulator
MPHSIRLGWNCLSCSLRYYDGVALGPDVALIAGLMGEPARAAILVALFDGRALPAGELAFIGNVAPQTASFHLRKLMDASLITVERQGKHSYYRLANERVAATLESIAALAPVRNQVDLRSRTRYESERVKELCFARTCYRHLAGVLAVEINQALLDRGLLVANSETTYCLTDRGRAWCRQLGMNLPSAIRPQELSSRACIDWTERRHHIGGALGGALFSRLTELRWIVKNSETRAVRVTHAGARALEQQLGITAQIQKHA